MADLTTSADVDSMMAAANNAAIRTAISVPALVGSTTDNAIVRFDSTAGQQQNSTVFITDGASPSIQLGGTSSSFPALIRDGVKLRVVLADNSQVTSLDTGPLVVDGAFQALGNVAMSGLPTADPAAAGQLWNNLGIVTVSAG
jgi:hypothetical protein